MKTNENINKTKILRKISGELSVSVWDIPKTLRKFQKDLEKLK